MHSYKRFKQLESLYFQNAKQMHLLAIDTGVDELNRQNQVRIMDAHCAWLCITEDILYREGLNDQARRAKLRSMHKTLLTKDFADIISVCKGAYDLMIELLSGKRKLYGEVAPYSEFKALLADFESSLVSAVLAPIKPILTQVLDHLTPSRSNGIYHSSVCVEVKLCAQYLTFPKKLELNNPALWEKATADYLVTESLNSSYDVSDQDEDLAFIQMIIGVWFAEFRVDWDNAKHGPGSVADTASIKRSSKNWALAGSKKIDFLLNGNEVYLNDKSESEEVNPTMGVLQEMLSIKGLVETSKLTCVPKDASKLRTISMEPATLQYLQQAIKCSLYDYIDSNPVGTHIHITDQTFNRAYAYDGSLQNNFATLDLSHASDSVTLKLVKQAFKKVPYLRRLLLLTRSTHTNVDGEDISLLKFAPMGSALCFPVECILFAAIAARSVQLGIKCGLLCHNDVDSNHFSVFGDDTIVPVPVAEICIRLLKKFGFSVNELKSYPTGPFKESCGGNYYCGYDITGIKYNPCLPTIKVKKNCIYHLDANSYKTFISYANAAESAGYKVFRCYCIWKIKSDGLKPLFTNNVDNNSAVYSKAPTNFHLNLRYHQEYQCCQYIYDDITPDKLKNDNDDFYIYYQSFMHNALISKKAGKYSTDLRSYIKACSSLSPQVCYTQGPWRCYTFSEPNVSLRETQSKRWVDQDDRNTHFCEMHVEPHEVIITP